MSAPRTSLILVVALISAMPAWGRQRGGAQAPNQTIHLSDIFMRDVCILPDAATQTYYMVGPGRNSVCVYTSKDLKTCQGPQTVFETPDDIWGNITVRGIWAPEMHKHQGKYYLFLTFDTRNMFGEQWPNWRPRVTRGSQVLRGDKARQQTHD